MTQQDKSRAAFEAHWFSIPENIRKDYGHAGWVAARAAWQAAIEHERKQRFESGVAKQNYDEYMEGEIEPDPIERLRFYCSIAMSGQDWLDVEPFFDDLIAERQQPAEPVSKDFGGFFNRGEAKLRGLKEPVKECKHVIADMTNEHVKSGFMCVNCGSLFKAAEPVNGPSDEKIHKMWIEHNPKTGAMGFARALLARYGNAAQPTIPEGWKPGVPECPYPCGWERLHKLAVHDGAYLARTLDVGQTLTDNQRATAIATSIRLIEVCRAMLAAAPKFGEEE